jgi:hypothetical protein
VKPHGNYVLVKYGQPQALYNVVTAGDWDKWERRHGHKTTALFWEEVARGTHAEMVALGKLMPEPKTLSFD